MKINITKKSKIIFIILCIVAAVVWISVYINNQYASKITAQSQFIQRDGKIILSNASENGEKEEKVLVEGISIDNAIIGTDESLKNLFYYTAYDDASGTSEIFCLPLKNLETEGNKPLLVGEKITEWHLGSVGILYTEDGSAWYRFDGAKRESFDTDIALIDYCDAAYIVYEKNMTDKGADIYAGGWNNYKVIANQAVYIGTDREKQGVWYAKRSSGGEKSYYDYIDDDAIKEKPYEPVQGDFMEEISEQDALGGCGLDAAPDYLFEGKEAQFEIVTSSDGEEYYRIHSFNDAPGAEQYYFRPIDQRWFCFDSLEYYNAIPTYIEQKEQYGATEKVRKLLKEARAEEMEPYTLYYCKGNGEKQISGNVFGAGKNADAECIFYEISENPEKVKLTSIMEEYEAGKEILSYIRQQYTDLSKEYWMWEVSIHGGKAENATESEKQTQDLNKIFEIHSTQSGVKIEETASVRRIMNDVLFESIVNEFFPEYIDDETLDAFFEEQEDGNVNVRVFFDQSDHTATVGNYTIDPVTGKGENVIEEEPIDIMDQIKKVEQAKAAKRYIQKDGMYPKSEDELCSIALEYYEASEGEDDDFGAVIKEYDPENSKAVVTVTYHFLGHYEVLEEYTINPYTGEGNGMYGDYVDLW
ncbi:MAG: hypothetical protein IJ682_08115 [Lachnospiraceae bacterium]|nr:hypothetical protein [Lachnospiraceae bacterium]